MDPLYDFIELLVGAGVPRIAELVFSFLDPDDLNSAERVCRLWKDVIDGGKLWKSHLLKVTCSNTKKKLYDWSPQWTNERPSDPLCFKLAYLAIKQHHRKLFFNWMRGAYNEERSELFRATGKSAWLDMNDEYIVVGQSSGKVIVFDRQKMVHSYGQNQTKQLEFERLLSGVQCMQLTRDNLLICGGAGGRIQILNLHTQQLIQQFTEKGGGCITHLHFRNGMLLTSSTSKTPNNLVSVWKISHSKEIILLDELMYSSVSVFGLSFDENFIVLALGQEPEFEIHVRSATDRALLYSLRYQSRSFSGFHYDRGFIAAGSDDGNIRIWEAGTGTCIRMLTSPTPNPGSFWLRFNSSFLVTNNSHGMEIWNFKNATSPKFNSFAKLHCSSIQSISEESGQQQWPFQMDDFEIVSYHHQQHQHGLSPINNRSPGFGFVVRRQFLCK